MRLGVIALSDFTVKRNLAIAHCKESVDFLPYRQYTELRYIGRAKKKVAQLLGVLGRASVVLDGGLLLSLYNGLDHPHLQYCLIVRGDFVADGAPLELPEEVCRPGGRDGRALPC